MRPSCASGRGGSPSRRRRPRRVGGPPSSGGAATGAAFAIEAAECAPAIVAHLLPVAGAGHDIVATADRMLVLIPAAREAKIDRVILRALYDLTVAESEVAGGVAARRTIQEIAQARQASVDTVRTQLRRVFDKTGTSRQVDLARLVLGLAVCARLRSSAPRGRRAGRGLRPRARTRLRARAAPRGAPRRPSRTAPASRGRRAAARPGGGPPPPGSRPAAPRPRR